MLELLLIVWALFAGLLMTRLTNLFKLPDVTAYLIIGVIIGPSVLGKLGIQGLGFTSFEEVNSFSLISDVALGFIAFAIGSEFELKEVKHIGKRAFIIGVFQALTATICVDVVIGIMHMIVPNIVTMPMAILLGAIATATAPAATIMVVRQYRAKGPVTDILLPVVAIDDAVGLMVFAISFGVATSLVSGTVNILNLIIEPLLEITLSLLLGAAVAYILTFLETKFYSNSNRLILIIASIILTVAIAKISFRIGSFGASFSSLLVCMMLGTVFCNICPLADDLMERANRWSQPIIVLFFVLSGAELDLVVFRSPIVVMVGVAYIIARSIGKYFGARVSAAACGCDENVVKYLGITLLPQAGVALGMSAIIGRSFGQHGEIVRNITLFGVLIYELFGPTFTKIALTKAGDIKEEPKLEKKIRDRMLLEHKVKDFFDNLKSLKR